MEAATHGRGVVVGARHQMREVVPQIFHELGPVGRSGDALREGAKDDTVYRVRLHAASGHARIYRAKSRLVPEVVVQIAQRHVAARGRTATAPRLFTLSARHVSLRRT